jgi:tetratricopeptide (TPR) repeat protein/tRNA A-37 threonylcarbamoyl transferase component Bud32
MWGSAALRSESDSTLALDSVAWTGIQAAVRSFRRALGRGEHPAIEAYAPERVPHRTAVVVELIQEEMEFQIVAGEPCALPSYLERFPEIADDPRAVSELAAAESALRRRAATELREGSTHPEKNDPPAASPVRIGRYELGDVIGQGAFGVVYRAWDTGLRRTVALKRPRAGALEAAGAVDRFLREARSAAGLRHPHIVSVHDVGQVDGEPFLVSALIEGRNLAEELAVRRFPFRQAAAWVASLAEALDHAHGLGVIHRDVKPSNVLIDGEGRAYLTDFGLAKNDAGAATLTIEGQLLGTPAYMAPEQAAGNERVDERTDIYCLGVILYELMTGTRPFHGSERMLLARIQEEDPQPPRRLDQAIPRDLETVCLKAMAKQPGRRYASAADLAADLRRHLRGEPVLARPVGVLGTVWRRCRRRALLSGLVASLVLAVVAGMAGVTWQWRRAEYQRHRAVEALQHGSQALAALLPLFDSGVDGQDRSRREREVLRTVVLEYYRSSVQHQLRTDPELRDPLSSITMGVIGLLHRTAPSDEALRAFQEARSSFVGLLRDDPTNPVVQDCAARCLTCEGVLLAEAGRLEEGEARLSQGCNQWQAYLTLKKREPAADLGYRSAREAWIGSLSELASVEVRLDRKAKALGCLRQALGLAEGLLREQPDQEPARQRLANVCSGLALQERDLRPDEAISLWRRASDLVEPIATANPAEFGVQDRLVMDLYSLAELEDRLGRVDEALADFRRAAAICERSVRAKTDKEPARRRLAYHCSRLALRARDLRPGEAISLWRRASDLVEPIATENPTDYGVLEQLVDYLYWLGGLEDRLDRMDEALADLRRAAVIYERLVRAKPDDVAHRCQLATCNHVIGRLLVDSGHSTEAIEPYRRAIAHRERLARDHPEDARWRRDCAGSWSRLKEALASLGRNAEALNADQQSQLYERRARAQETRDIKQHLAGIQP